MLPSSHSLPKLPLARADGLPPLGHTRLPPIKDSETSPYAVHRSYPSMSDRPTFDAPRRPSPSSSIPVGMVSADYMHSRRSPGDTAPPTYHPLHMRHPDAYRQDTLPSHASSHVPHHIHYDAPPPHMRHASEVEPVTAGTPIKRPRVSLACLACRNRKSRCDGVRPTCKTCANMSEYDTHDHILIFLARTDLFSLSVQITEIECKWPEVDFRRAKTGDAARARKRSPAGASSQRSPDSVEQKPRGMPESASDVYGRPAAERGTLPPSQSMPMVPMASSSLPPTTSMSTSPTLSRSNRFRTHSDGDRETRYAESSLHASRSPTERNMHPSFAHESRSGPYGREAHARPYSSAGVPGSRHDSSTSTSWTRDDRAEPYPQDRRLAWENQPNRPVRPMPESRMQRPNAAATRCKDRAAEIAILARPATDAQRLAVEAFMTREISLEDLADKSTAGERLDFAFAADWDAIGGLSHAARRPFMDVAAGIAAVLELFGPKGTVDASARLHLFRLRNGTSTHPDLRHFSIATDLSPREERELLETTSSAYDTLSYPIPVDRLSLPLINGVQRALDNDTLKAENHADVSVVRSPIHPSSPPPADVIPYVRQEDVKPPQRILELLFQRYVDNVGDQMPGLDTKTIGARIRDGSISALFANALCSIGASLYERVGQQPPASDALSSKVYFERARALIGVALQNPDLEAILALGVMAIRDILMGQVVSSAVLVSSAVRLCMQLDLHRARPTQHRQPSPASDAADGGDASKKLIADDVFWMTYCLDRITSIATARPLAIKDRDIDTPFPATMRKGEPCIFAALVRQLHYLGRLAEVALSSPVSGATSGSNDRERAREMEIAAVGADLIGHYESLPSVLQLGSANLNRAHEKGDSLSFLQLHLTHNMALLHRFLLSEAPMTNADYDAMRSAANETVEICLLGDSLNPTMLADTPLSAVACFLAGCVSLSEMEFLEESMQTASSESASLSMVAQLEAARSNLAKLMDTLVRHAKFWPVARKLLGVLETQKARPSTPIISPSTIASLVSQVEAIHILVRRPGEASDRLREASNQTPVQIRKVADLEMLRTAFPHLC